MASYSGLNWHLHIPTAFCRTNALPCIQPGLFRYWYRHLTAVRRHRSGGYRSVLLDGAATLSDQIHTGWRKKAFVLNLVLAGMAGFSACASVATVSSDAWFHAEQLCNATICGRRVWNGKSREAIMESNIWCARRY